MTTTNTAHATTRTTRAGGLSTLLEGDGLLRNALKLDAAVTGLNGVGYLVGAALLDDLLGLPAAPLRGIGAFLLVYGVAVWLVARRPSISRPATGVIIAVNLMWAVDSLALAAVGWGSPTGLGTLWIVLQALVVGGFAALQWTGLRGRRAR